MDLSRLDQELIIRCDSFYIIIIIYMIIIMNYQSNSQRDMEENGLGSRSTVGVTINILRLG